MHMMRFARILPALGLLALCACGGQSSDTPSDLQVTTYPAGEAFTLSLTMQACSDVCAEYDEPNCSVDVDGNTIKVNASLSWSRQGSDSECPNLCGPPKFAHCDVSALDAGTYTVESGQFRKDIVVR